MLRGSLTARALLASRLLALLAGACGVLSASAGRPWGPTNIGLGSVGNVLAGSAVRFDANWYLAIARHGYAATGTGSRAFWPLYPELVRVLGYVVGSDVIAGVAISLGSFAAGGVDRSDRQQQEQRLGVDRAEEERQRREREQ